MLETRVFFTADRARTVSEVIEENQPLIGRRRTWRRVDCLVDRRHRAKSLAQTINADQISEARGATECAKTTAESGQAKKSRSGTK